MQIAALIETANRSLTLYHAIIIMHMLVFLMGAISPISAYRRATLSRPFVYWIVVRSAPYLLFNPRHVLAT